MRDNARIGGVLSIVAGGWAILWTTIFVLLLVLTIFVPFEFDTVPPDEIFISLIPISLFGCIFLLLGALGIVGGIFALKRKYWGWSLAGGIAGAITMFPCGIPAVIFITLGKPEFDSQAKPLTAAEGANL
jgi:hypothetical protein